MLPGVTIRIVLELDGDGDPIRGRLIEPERQAGEFYGWLVLASLIESVRLNAGQALYGAEPD